MASLSDSIRSSAERRLCLPEGRTPAQELSRYKEYLRHETDRLRQVHRAGAGGREVCQARTLVLDLLLRHLMEAASARMPEIQVGDPLRIALIAIGGYGRGELNPRSDIDIMFLHNLDGGALARGRADPRLSALTDGLLYTLWDVGIKVGHSVRSMDDIVRVANTDMQSKTSLLEARTVDGDEQLFRRAEAVFLAKCVRDQAETYLDMRIRDQEARRAKYGDSATMQEPNIKNGCGGLRDYQNLLWMAFFKYRTRSLDDLRERELISDGECSQLESAYDFLLRVRNELHYETDRAADVLVRPLQPRVALHLGYTHRSPVRRLEEFMRDLYLHMRGIFLITRTLEQRLALLPDPRRRLPSLRQLIQNGRRRIGRQLVDGFEFADGEIRPISRRVFRDQPRRLFRVFLHAQQRGLRLHPDLTQLIRHHLNLVTKELRQDPRVCETFLEILNQRGNVAPILRAMHETGLLGRYIPEFEPLTCLVQHEFYHQYAADEHTLQCLTHLDRVWEAKTPPHSGYTEILESLERPYLLYLALLLHDAGKASREPDHASRGARLAADVARRLNLDEAMTDSLVRLIQHHLLMTQISQRRDLDDPNVIRNFAAQIKTEENLRMLTLHTLADSLATGDQLWNSFKDSLLLTLFHRAQEDMSGAMVFREAEERHLERLRKEVWQAVTKELAEDEVRAHFELLPPRYFSSLGVEDITSDLRLVHRFLQRQIFTTHDPLRPLITWENEPDRGCTTLKICTWDRPGSFSEITGSLTAAGLNILGAQIFTRLDNILLDRFSVVEARTGRLVDREAREKCEKLLNRVLGSEGMVISDTLARRKLPPSLYYSVEGARIQTYVNFHNDISDYYTVLDLETEDHVGLLHAAADELAKLNLDIALARISTDKGAAVDSFYITGVDACKITDPQHQQEIARRLLTRIAALNDQGAP